MFANFALPDLARVSRRTVLGGLVFGVIGLIACLALGAPLTGLGLCIGLGLGLLNFRLIQRSVIKVGAREDENHKRPLAANTVARLAVISALALGLLFLSFELGLGVMVGLAAWYAALQSVGRLARASGSRMITALPQPRPRARALIQAP